MSNDFSAKKPEVLQAISANLLDKASKSPTVYNIPKTASDALDHATMAIATASARIESAKTEMASATRDKGSAKSVTVEALNNVAGIVYGQPAIKAGQIAALGLAPRRASPARPTMPLPVTGLTVVPYADGSVVVKFDKNGNRASAIYGIETSADGLAFEPYLATTRSRETLTGFAPGQPCWFRVVARNSMGAALPSASTSVYAPAAPASVQLKLAA